MTTYHLAALPVVLLLIAALWPVALFVILAAAVAWLWVSRRRERNAADRYLASLAREVKAAERIIAAREQELAEERRSHFHAIPAQRKPPQNADDGWWSRLYGQEDKA